MHIELYVRPMSITVIFDIPFVLMPCWYAPGRFSNFIRIPHTRYFIFKNVSTRGIVIAPGGDGVMGSSASLPLVVWVDPHADLGDKDLDWLSLIHCGSKCSGSNSHKHGVCMFKRVLVDSGALTILYDEEKVEQQGREMLQSPTVFPLDDIWGSDIFAVKAAARDHSAQVYTLVQLISAGVQGNTMSHALCVSSCLTRTRVRAAGQWMCELCCLQSKSFRDCTHVHQVKSNLEERGFDPLDLASKLCTCCYVAPCLQQCLTRAICATVSVQNDWTDRQGAILERKKEYTVLHRECLCLFPGTMDTELAAAVSNWYRCPLPLHRSILNRIVLYCSILFHIGQYCCMLTNTLHVAHVSFSL